MAVEAVDGELVSAIEVSGAGINREITQFYALCAAHDPGISSLFNALKLEFPQSVTANSVRRELRTCRAHQATDFQVQGFATSRMWVRGAGVAAHGRPLPGQLVEQSRPLRNHVETSI